ncbi:MAG: hypothetical protein ACRDBG_17735 [Waterburya sp.]
MSESSLVKAPYPGDITVSQICAAEEIVAAMLRVNTLDFEDSIIQDFQLPFSRAETFISVPRGKGLVRQVASFTVDGTSYPVNDLVTYASGWLFRFTDRTKKFQPGCKYSITFSRGYDNKTLPEQLRQAIFLVASSVGIPGKLDIQSLRALELRDLRLTTDASNQGYKSISDMTKLKNLIRLYIPPRSWYGNY